MRVRSSLGSLPHLLSRWMHTRIDATIDNFLLHVHTQNAPTSGVRISRNSLLSNGITLPIFRVPKQGKIYSPLFKYRIIETQTTLTKTPVYRNIIKTDKGTKIAPKRGDFPILVHFPAFSMLKCHPTGSTVKTKAL